MIISGYSFDKVGPYLIFCDIESGEYKKFSLENKNLNITKIPKRYCIGAYDLSSCSYKVCPQKNKLDLSIIKVKSHSDNQFNNYADLLAVKSRRKLEE